MIEPIITSRHAFLKLMELLAIAAESVDIDLDETVLPIGGREYTVIDLGDIVLAALPKPKLRVPYDN